VRRGQRNHCVSPGTGTSIVADLCVSLIEQCQEDEIQSQQALRRCSTVLSERDALAELELTKWISCAYGTNPEVVRIRNLELTPGSDGVADNGWPLHPDKQLLDLTPLRSSKKHHAKRTPHPISCGAS
jgi:hypothetical protein